MTFNVNVKKIHYLEEYKVKNNRISKEIVYNSLNTLHRKRRK